MLRRKLQDDQIAALKSGDRDKLSVLRFVISEIKNREMEKNPPEGGELTDEETAVVLRKMAKELKESIEAFEKGNRPDLVTENRKQLAIVESYLPAEVSDEELKAGIDRIIAENKDAIEKNPKVVIGIAMKQLKAKADPQRIMKTLQPFLRS